MSGIFDLKSGAFDSSEAGRLYKAFDIALQGLRATHEVDNLVVHRLARSVVKVARTEPDCLRNDGTIDPVRLAQRAILRMLQVSAPAVQSEEPVPADRVRRKPRKTLDEEGAPETMFDSRSKVMMRLFDRTIFAKL